LRARLLGLPAFRDVADKARKQRRSFRLNTGYRELHGEFAAIGPPAGKLQPSVQDTAFPRRQIVLQALAVPVLERRWNDERRQLSTQYIGAAVLERLFRRGVPFDDLA